MPWQKLIVEIDPESRERIEESVVELGALSISLEDAGDEPLLEPAPGETPLWSALRLIALFPDEVDRETVNAALATGETRWERLDDRDWERVWLADFKPECFGGHLWVCPHGEKTPAAGAVVRLDPGLAFGTGRHPTTALCLEWLATAPLNDRTVVDYGCGSGILGVAAAVLGAARIVAVDIDPQALLATRDNAAANGVRERFTISAPEDLAPEPADILVANILSGPLVRLAPQLAAAVRPGGALVLSGILDEQAAQVRAAYAPWFDELAVTTRSGWVRIDGERNKRVHTVS